MHGAACDADGRLLTWGWGGSAGGGGFLQPDIDLGGGQLGHGEDRDQYTPAEARQAATVHFAVCASLLCTS